MIRLIDRKKTLEMVLTGDTIKAQESQRLGLINQVVPEAQLQEAASSLAEKLAAKAACSADRQGGNQPPAGYPLSPGTGSDG